MVEPGWVIAIVAVINLALSVGAIMFTWHSNRNQAQRGEIDEMKLRLNEEAEQRRGNIGSLRDRITRIETDMSHLPSAVAVAAMQGDISAMKEMLAAGTARMERIESYLLNEGTRK